MRYFFNLAGAVHDPDNDGFDLADLAQARIESVKFAGDVLHDNPECVWAGEELRVEVSDSEGELLFTIGIVGVDAPAQGKS